MLSSASNVTITLSAANDSNLNPYPVLYDAQFKPIGEHDDIEQGVIKDSALYDIALTEPGLYWITAGRCCPGNDQGSVGRYRLEVTVKQTE